jgi:hypothetical protein
MRTLLPAVLLLVSMAGVAGEFSVTKSAAPRSIYKPDIRGISVVNVPGGDYPRGAMMVSRLKSVDWSTTWYPNSTGETADICLVYGGHYDCENIQANSTGSTTFKTPYRYSSLVVIRHKTKAGVINSNPAGKDVVRFNFSY